MSGLATALAALSQILPMSPPPANLHTRESEHGKVSALMLIMEDQSKCLKRCSQSRKMG